VQLTTLTKGTVEGHVRYVKQNALAGRSEELIGWDDYRRLATTWRDDVANLRIHATTGQRPVDRFEEERSRLRALPAEPFDADETVAAVVTSHARVSFDGNRYSVPPQFARKPVTVRACEQQVRLIYQGRAIASHARSYDRGQAICQTEHQLQALQMRHRARAHHLEDSFDALGEVACQFHLKLRTRPVKTTLHLRRLLNLVRLYGRAEVLAAIARAYQYETYDAAYVESIVLQERRRREIPSPTPLRPKRRELVDEIDFEAPDPASYDRLFGTSGAEEQEP